MKKEVDFSRGTRGKYAGQRLRIVGDAKLTRQKEGERRYLVKLPSGVEFDVFAVNKTAARQSVIDFFGRGRLPKGAKITLADKTKFESAQITAIGSEAVVVLPKRIMRKLKVRSGDELYFVEKDNGIELSSEPIVPEALKKSA